MDKGAITEMPYISIDDLMKGKKPSKIDPETRKRNYERYLAEISCFVVNFEKGSAFVEVQDPMRDVSAFIASKNRQYICQQCGTNISANDDIDHTGGKCATCGSEKTKRINPADLRENMNRIQSLIDYHKAVK